MHRFVFQPATTNSMATLTYHLLYAQQTATVYGFTIWTLRRQLRYLLENCEAPTPVVAVLWMWAVIQYSVAIGPGCCLQTIVRRAGEARTAEVGLSCWEDPRARAKSGGRCTLWRLTIFLAILVRVSFDIQFLL
jgi:hypothetical protein